MLRFVFIGIALIMCSGLSYGACWGNGTTWTCDYQNEAYSACMGKADANTANVSGAATYYCRDDITSYTCRSDDGGGGCNSAIGTPSEMYFRWVTDSVVCNDPLYPTPVYTDGQVTSCDDTCAADVRIDGAIWPDGGTGTLCVGSCSYQQAGVAACFPNNFCYGDLSSNGDPCSGADGTSPPDGCSYSATDGSVVCDCVATPDAPFCAGGAYPDPDNCIYDELDGSVSCYSVNNPDATPPGTNDGGGSDQTFTGSNPPGDGNPDTPNNAGDGDGDTDGDGTRDVDCDPLSNSDCGFSGSASASGVCGTVPTCVGEPSQCAALVQQYNIMCAVIESGNRSDAKLDKIAKLLPVSKWTISEVEYKGKLKKAADTEAAILKEDGSFFQPSDGNKTKLEELKALFLDKFNTQTNSIFVSAACPNFAIDIAAAGFTYTFPFDQTVGKYTRAIMAVFLWVWAFYTSYWLFVTWAMKA